MSRLGPALLLLVAAAARAGGPCPAEMAAQARAVDAEVSKRFGKKLTSPCTCQNSKCDRASLAYDLPPPTGARVKLSTELWWTLVTEPLPLNPDLTPEALKAFVDRTLAHPQVRPVLEGKDGKCNIRFGPGSRASCFSDRWSVELAEYADRFDGGRLPFELGYYRLPLAALEGDPDLAVAKADPRVAKFLEGKKDVSVSFNPNWPHRLNFRQGLDQALTAFVRIDRDGKLALLCVCDGEQRAPCQ